MLTNLIAMVGESMLDQFVDPKKWENFMWDPKVSPSKVDLVIASYNENLWYVRFLKKIGYNVIVYNVNKHPIYSFLVDKNTKEPCDLEPVDCIKIENRSQEASQWLHHLVNNRNSLNEFSVFLQGDLGFCLRRPAIGGVGPDRVMEIYDFLNTFTQGQNWLNVPVNELSVELASADIRDKFAHFFEPLPTPFAVPKYLGPSVSAGQFLTSRTNILRIPESHIQKLYDYTTQHHRAAWEFEYHWGLLLDGYAFVWPRTVKPEGGAPKNELPEQSSTLQRTAQKTKV